MILVMTFSVNIPWNIFVPGYTKNDSIMHVHYSVFIYACANNVVGILLCITKLIPVVVGVLVFHCEIGALMGLGNSAQTK